MDIVSHNDVFPVARLVSVHLIAALCNWKLLELVAAPLSSLDRDITVWAIIFVALITEI
jgi:hypothetical protein